MTPTIRKRALAKVKPRGRQPDARSWSLRISAAWQKSAEQIIETGRLLSKAKEALEHGQFQRMIEQHLPFGARTAQMLMAIAADPRLSNAKHVSHLPPSYGTMYAIHQLDDRQFERALKDGTINPEAERSDIVGAFKQEKRAEREENLAQKQRALPDKKYGVIYADPEWRFEPYSRDSGMDRAADNHYPTSETIEICARPVPKITADDAVLFLWATVPMLKAAFEVMDHWGFDYKSQFIWRKPKIGTGYWNRNAHEILLVGTRGSVPAPAPGTQWESVIDAPLGRHSEKPEKFYELIESYFPNLPKIELNARNARPGWDSWGNEAPESCDTKTGEVTEAA